ncbi:membrane protein [Rhizobium leguminosarum bv. trifolii CB782]|nr:membrane protein [Rhizobium leguminosarum bv. trifolii CB782]
MADFIAVIRRAVDGLAENTPEMRVKVYERARGAVQRQLENMKPRPPEAMLQRQLEKLEAAIREVEGEHSEALPLDEPVTAVVASEAVEEQAVHDEVEPAPAPETVVEEPPVEEPAYEVDAEPQVAEAAGEPDHAEAAAAPEDAAEEVVAEKPPSEDTLVSPETTVSAEASPEEAAPVETYWHPSHEEEAPAEEWHASEARAVAAEEATTEHDDWQPTAGHRGEEADEYHADEHPVDETAAEPAAVESEEPEVEEANEPVAPLEPITRGIEHASNRLVEPLADFDRPQEFVEHSREEPLQAEAAAHFDPIWAEPAAETPAPAPKDAETEWAEEELRQYSQTAPITPDTSARAFEEVISSLEKAAPAAVMPAAKESFSWETAAFDDLPPIEAGSNKKAPVASHFDDVDIFAEVHNGKPAAASGAPSEDWREAKALRGYDRRGSVAADDDDANPAMDIDQMVASKLQGKSFRMEPKRRRFGIGTVITLIFALILIGGGAYAGWMNREALVAMVDGLVSSAPSQATRNEAATPPAGSATPAEPDAATPAQPTTPEAQNTPAAPAQPNPQVASMNNDGAAANSKFTQRLLTDGTEVDSGPATVPGTLTAEGKSVAEQNVAAADTPPAAAQGDVAPAETPTPNSPAASPQQAAPVGSSQKMFLYEERIGQSSPTAIEGSVVWSVQHEAGQNGRQEATVQGNVTVPERNLSALVTFKRNSDPSLPASHLVEIVFSLPPNFEGGSIDSVQRISMKRTEQDRGDALIAVPAKITDDFHMIALNDYPDARKANLDLMSTRSWIDIPVTYRNGRRALLTMEKGNSGTDAFNTAIKEWTALGDVSTSQ